MNLSQKLLAMSEELQRLRANQEENNRKPSEHQESRVEDSEALNTEELAVKYHKEEGTKSTRFKKKRGKLHYILGEAAVVNDKVISEAINEKEELMEMSVKAYMVNN